MGKEAAAYIDRGALVPDDVIVNLVAERLKGPDCAAGFILDGFPRTIPQAAALDEILAKLGLDLNGVLAVKVPREVVVERLAGRRNCSGCGAPYHVLFDPPRKEGVCDRCGGELFQRDDDREQTVLRRLEVYDAQTAPLADYYRRRGVLKEIDGVGTIDEIRSRVIQALGDNAA